MAIMNPSGQVSLWQHFTHKIRKKRASLDVAIKTAILTTATSFLAMASRGYVLEGKSWPAATVATLQVQLGTLTKTLQDGSASWNAAVAPVFNMWNQTVQGVHLNS